MYQRDYLLTEIQKLANLLAKLMGLKVEGDHNEYIRQFNDILQEEYNIELEKLIELNEDELTADLNSAGYSAEKLNALAQMLYIFAEPFKLDDQTELILKKVLIIFDLLEKHHHYQSFENIDKRNTIYKHLIEINERT